MKLHFWRSLAALLLVNFGGHAQSLTGVWQGVENEYDKTSFCPSVLRVQQRAGTDLFGILYQEDGSLPEASVTFQMEGTPTPAGLTLAHVRELAQTARSRQRYWCAGSIAFTYDAAQEKLTGSATYEPYGKCTTGKFVFYRVKLKSAATVPTGALSTLRVSGRDVRWYADPELKQPLATGNTYATRLRKTTTFYLRQGFYATAESPAVPITIRVSAAAPAEVPTFRPPAAPPDTLRSVAAAPAPAPAPLPATVAAPILAPTAAPVVLPTVLFKLATAELLPAATPALDQLAAELQARPALRLLVAGHTDRVGESAKNQLLSEQRAEAVRAYLVKAGVAAERLRTVGYGDTRPRYPAPDARNRRVEVQALP